MSAPHRVAGYPGRQLFAHGPATARLLTVVAMTKLLPVIGFGILPFLANDLLLTRIFHKIPNTLKIHDYKCYLGCCLEDELYHYVTMQATKPKEKYKSIDTTLNVLYQRDDTHLASIC